MVLGYLGGHDVITGSSYVRSKRVSERWEEAGVTHCTKGPGTHTGLGCYTGFQSSALLPLSPHSSALEGLLSRPFY